MAKTFVIRHLKDCAHMIDEAIKTAITMKKPVYLEIPSNFISQKIASPSPLSFTCNLKQSDKLAEEACVDDIINRLKMSVKPVCVAGVKLKTGGAINFVICMYIYI